MRSTGSADRTASSDGATLAATWFALCRERGVDWEPDSDELTPTMKLKRKPIAAKYADEIEALYEGNEESARATAPAGAVLADP